VPGATSIRAGNNVIVGTRAFAHNAAAKQKEAPFAYAL